LLVSGGMPAITHTPNAPVGPAEVSTAEAPSRKRTRRQARLEEVEGLAPHCSPTAAEAQPRADSRSSLSLPAPAGRERVSKPQKQEGLPPSYCVFHQQGMSLYDHVFEMDACDYREMEEDAAMTWLLDSSQVGQTNSHQFPAASSTQVGQTDWLQQFLKSPSIYMPRANPGSPAARVVTGIAAALGTGVHDIGSTSQSIHQGMRPSWENLVQACTEFRQNPLIDLTHFADHCQYRAHVFAGQLHKAGFDCHKLFVHGDLAAATPWGGRVKWGYHVAPLVYTRQPDGGMQPFVVDLTLHPEGPIAPEKWAALFNQGQSIEVQVTDSTWLYPYPKSYPYADTSAMDHSLGQAVERLEKHNSQAATDELIKILLSEESL
jgi:hypothetical protein